MDTHWRTYEEVATFLLNKFSEELNLSRVEGKQTINGRSGITWNIDAKGFRKGDEGIVIIECRRHTTSRLNKESVGGVAYRITNTGAVGGIIVSPLGLQLGAKLIASAENIISVRLNKDCTPTQFCMQFLKKIFIGHEEKTPIKDVSSAVLIRICKICGKSFEVKKNENTCQDCIINIKKASH